MEDSQLEKIKDRIRNWRKSRTAEPKAEPEEKPAAPPAQFDSKGRRVYPGQGVDAGWNEVGRPSEFGNS